MQELSNLPSDPQLIEGVKESFREVLDVEKLPAFLDDEQTSTVLDRKAGSLRVARSTGKNCPPFSKVGKSVRYSTDLLARWVLSQTFTSTGQYQQKQAG